MPGVEKCRTTPRMASMYLKQSAGFTMPSIIPRAVNMSAIIASTPRIAIRPCMKLDPFILLCSFLPAAALSIFAEAATDGVGENPCTIELDFCFLAPVAKYVVQNAWTASLRCRESEAKSLLSIRPRQKCAICSVKPCCSQRRSKLAHAYRIR